MRTRNRTIVLDTRISAPQQYSAKISDNPIPTYTYDYAGFPSTIVHRVDERMVDRDDGDHILPNPCSHRSSEVQYLHPGLSDYKETAPSGHNGTITYLAMGDAWWMISKLIDNALQWDVVSKGTPPGLSLNLPVVNEDILINDLAERAAGQIADHALNLVELDDIPRSVNSVKDYLPNLRDNWRRWQKAIAKEKLRGGTGALGPVARTFRDTASTYLGWKFGFAPLISDLTATWKFLSNSKAKLSKYKDDKVVRVGKSFRFTPTYSIDHAFDFTASGVHTYEASAQYVDSGTGEVVYSVYVKPLFTRLPKVLSGLQDLVNRFGSGPAELAWEHLPFSFVVDWFVDLRSTLRAADVMVGYEPIKIVGITKGMKWSGDISSHVTFRQAVDGAVIVDYPGYRASGKGYERSILQIGHKPILRNRFGKNQAGVAAALVTQMLLGLKTSKPFSFNKVNEAIGSTLRRRLPGRVFNAITGE